MSPEPKVVLQLPVSDAARLPVFVERCLADNVTLIAVMGEGAADIEEQIDWLIIGDATDDSRFITTSCHTGESLEEVVAFATAWRINAGGPTTVVRL